MDYLSKIDSQLLVLRDFLYQQITSDYVYLDVPGHMNVGNQLIAMGAWRLLDELPYKCVYRSTIRAFDFKMPENVIVLLHGGGNFGDLYPVPTGLGMKLFRSFQIIRLFFLPQTITYKDNALIEKDAEVCSHHENLHICARDMNSYHLLERYFSRNNIYLVPDTAWGLYDFLKKHSVDDNVGKSMLMKRKDFEIGKEWNICADDVKDWDDILHEINIDCKFLIYRVLNKLGRMFNGHVFSNCQIRF